LVTPGGQSKGVTQMLSMRLAPVTHSGFSGAWQAQPLKRPSLHCGGLLEMQTRPPKVVPAGQLGFSS
jgi:hypothetical protein